VDERLHIVRQRARVVVELAPGDAGHTPPGALQRAVANAVALEGVPRAVGCEPVEFDYQPGAWPREVGLDRSDRRVDQRGWQFIAIGEGEEAVLELAARRRGLGGREAS
jgi:hypothetical protein